MIISKAKTNNEGMNQYEKRFYKLLSEQQVLIEQEKLLGEIEQLKKKKNYTRRLNMKLKIWREE